MNDLRDNKRYTIACLVANIVDAFSNQAAIGAMAAAEELDVNLIIVPGKYICQTSYTNSDTVYEYQYNNLFSYINNTNVDAACVCTGTIAYANSAEEKREFLSRLGDMPVISIAAKIDGFEYVVYDNTDSVRACTDYIINKQGKKRIAMLSGYTDNSDYCERLEGYKLALKDNGIEYDEEIVVFCNPSRMCREDAERLLDEHPDIEAIICSNDDMCLAVYELCTDRGMKIGTDILVAGFDDMDYAEKLEPPLTSIRASAEDLGYRAVMNAYACLTGKEISSRNVPTRFIPRLSCGYMGSRITDLDIFLSGSSEDKLEKLMYFMFSGSENCNDAYLNRNMKNIFDRVEKIEKCGRLEKEDTLAIIESAEKMINYDKDYFLYLKNIHMVADALYERLAGKMTDEKSRLALESLYLEVYRYISRDVSNLVYKAGEVSIDMLRRSNILVRDTLMIGGSVTEEGSYSAILRRLPLLEVNSSYLYLLPEPVVYRQGDKLYDISRWKFMSYSHFDKTCDVPEEDRNITLDRLFRNRYIPDDKRVTLVMADLYSGEYQYGILLCELKSKFFEYLEFITYQFGAAVKILKLFGELERHMNELHNDNIALEGASKKDELTGLLNRRGFYAQAEECIEQYKGSDKYAVLVFADLDYLKYINDNYGHNEGDYALRAAADVLRKLFRSTDIIGRTGGDEFNIMAVVNEPDFEDRIIKRKNACVEALNINAKKPYRIDISMGICEFRCSEIIDLPAVIEQADNALYKVKRSRRYNPYLNEAQ